MRLYSQVLLVLLWGLGLSSPIPPSLDTSPAVENRALPDYPFPNSSSTKEEVIRNSELWNPNGNLSTPRLHHHRTQTKNNSDSGSAYRNIAFLNPTPDVRTQSAPSPVKHRDSVGKMSQPSIDVSHIHAMVPNYFVMNHPYSKIATGIESDSDKKGKFSSHLNETDNELDYLKYANLTLREQHLVWKKEMLENKVEGVDTKVYQVQNNIIVYSHNSSEKFHAPYKINITISGNKSQINIENSSITKPLPGVEEKSAEKSLMLTNSKITNRRLLINNTGLNPNEIHLGPNEIRVSVTLKDKDGRKFIVPAIYTSKVSNPPPLTNTEDLALIPVDRNVDVNDIMITTNLPDIVATGQNTTISERTASLQTTTSRPGIETTEKITTISERIASLLTTTSRPDIVTTEEIPTISERIASLLTTTSRPDIVTTEEITTISERIASLQTTTSRPDIVTTEEITTISERIASLLSTTKVSPSPEPVTSSRIPVTPIPSRIFHQSTKPLIKESGTVALPAAMATSVISENVMKITKAPTTVQPISTSDVYDESIKIDTSMISQTAGRPLVQDVEETIQGRRSTTGPDMTQSSVYLDQNISPPDDLSISSTVDAFQSETRQLGSAQEIQSVDASLESLLLSSEKAFNESKKISQSSNTTDVPPFLQDIITKIDDRLTELIRETVAKYVENSENTTDAPAGAAKAIPHQTSLNKNNLDGADSETTKPPIKAVTRQVSLLRLSLDAALSGTTKAPTKSEPGQKPFIKINLDGESSSPTKPLIKINLDGELLSPPKPPPTKPSRFSRFRGNTGILGLTQIEPILERITGEISNGADRVRKELSYLAEDSADNLLKNVEEASERVSEITATSYRGALQTRDAMNRLLGRAVENLGKFVSNAVQDTVKTAFGTAQSVGQFIHDLNVNAMDGILNQGTAVRNLFSNTINDMSEATNRTVQVLSRVMEKNTQTLLDK